MLEGLSNITTQTCFPLCGQKTKLDDSKRFSILNWGIGIESEILWKQVRGQGSKLENENKLKMNLKVYYM